MLVLAYNSQKCVELYEFLFLLALYTIARLYNNEKWRPFQLFLKIKGTKVSKFNEFWVYKRSVNRSLKQS